MPYQNLSDLISNRYWSDKIDAQNKNKELMQQHLFSQQERATPTAYEQDLINQQNRNHADLVTRQKQTDEEHFQGLLATGKIKETDAQGRDLGAPTTPTSPAQKAVANPAASGPADATTNGTGGAGGGGLAFDPESNSFKPTQGPLTPTSIPGGSPSGGMNTPSGGGASAPPIGALLMPSGLPQGPLTGGPGAAPQGNAVATSQASRAQSAQSGPIAQSQQGSVTPSQTAAGATGSASGELPAAGYKPAQLNDHFYRATTPDEQNTFTQNQARQAAATDRQTRMDSVNSFTNDPQNKQYLTDNPDAAAEMRAYAQTGQKAPINTLIAQRAELGAQLNDAIARGDTAGADRIKSVLGSLNPPRQTSTDLGGINHSGLTQEALDAQARKFNESGGDMAAIGMGNAAISVRTAIMNRAAEMTSAAGGPVDLAANKGAYKANVSSLGKLTTQHDAVMQFENTGRANLDLFEQQARELVAKHGDIGVTLLNTPLRAVDRMLGNDEVPAYEAARQVAVNEIAKVTSNPGLTGVLSDSARKEITAFNPENATLSQTLHVADVLRQDMENRRIWSEAQIGEIGKRLGRGAASLTAESLGGETPKNVTSAPARPSVAAAAPASTGGKTATQADLVRYVQQNGGDKVKARAALLKDGFTIP